MNFYKFDLEQKFWDKGPSKIKSNKNDKMQAQSIEIGLRLLQTAKARGGHGSRRTDLLGPTRPAAASFRTHTYAIEDSRWPLPTTQSDSCCFLVLAERRRPPSEVTFHFFAVLSKLSKPDPTGNQEAVALASLI